LPGKRTPTDFSASTVIERPARFCSTDALLRAMTFV